MAHKFYIDPKIERASTLPASFYRDPSVFEALKDKIFYKSWQWIETELPETSGFTVPFTMLPQYLDEPLLLTRDENGRLHCLSNVCTHRGNLLFTQAKKTKKLTCGYHGRRFGLNGSFEFMPEFKQARDFPSPCDDLHKFPIASWGPLSFAGLEPAFDFNEILHAIDQRVGFLKQEAFKLDKTLNKDYFIEAHWALYCDNFLEGFHIPFVHNDLNAVLDYGNYETVVGKHYNLQIGYAEGNEDVFDLPEGHVDYGKDVAAYYFWVFPNMMFNFYPWGLSFNWVQPLEPQKTKVSFRSYVYDASKLGKGAGHGLHTVEMEDEAVVEGVQKGLLSRYYKSGRFSPSREAGVHHFHSLLAAFLNRE
ncbi:aromatic ring-hydroxylating oxygenase subunit alpha [Robiginitalea sp. IMCC43444]|uniref:aromatic ring-hydroxylating oxygenase subunit alpha n=1 Tax=Robiginitalea sp. IMCC43444 TaxID=3459121 RepID=UPI0040434878